MVHSKSTCGKLSLRRVASESHLSRKMKLTRPLNRSTEAQLIPIFTPNP